MLVVECEKTCRKIKIMPGLYKLNTAVSNFVDVCEYIDSQTRCAGIIEVSCETPVRTYEYTFADGCVQFDDYMDTPLPSRDLRQHWAKIVYDEEEKHAVLMQLLKIHQLRARPQLMDAFAINNALLIHGPPGTGKTTLGKALAQKLAIRTQEKLVLREVNCGRLFSKFYGESLQIIARVFSDRRSNVVYLVDEVESLLSQRSCILAKNEPNDSLRLVNEFLAILDRGSSMFIFTSNFPDALDPAFLDRCDLKVEMGLPCQAAVYEIIRSTIHRVMDDGFFKLHSLSDYDDASGGLGDPLSKRLLAISGRMHGVSGRQVKKILFDAIMLEMGRVEELLTSLERKYGL